MIILYAGEKILLNSLMALKQPSPPNGPNKKSASQTTMARDVTFDDLLVAVGTSRNRDAFIRLFEYFAPRVKSFLMKSGLSPEAADEIAQETMLTVWNKAAGYNPAQAAASTWIFTIARNKKIDLFRKNARRTLDPHDPHFTPDSETPDFGLEKAQENKILIEAIKKLPEEQGFLVRKSFFEEKTHQDIADETGIALGTVKSRIRLALEKMHHELDKKGIVI
jgi:RNA polymerase sigma-70 factor (ECF subfamily)